MFSAIGGFRYLESIPAPTPTDATAGWFGGGYGGATPGGKSIVSRITYATDTATGSTRGPLAVSRGGLSGVGNNGNLTYGWYGGGFPYTCTIDRITYANDTPAAVTRGPLTSARAYGAGTGTSSFGWWGGGQISPGGVISAISRLIFATDTVATTNRGGLAQFTWYLSAVTDKTTYGWFGGGLTPGLSPNLYSNITRLVYATDTALTTVRSNLSGNRYLEGSTSNSTYGWWGGGFVAPAPGAATKSSAVRRLTFASDTSTTGRGPLVTARSNLAATGNDNYGYFGGGTSATATVSTVERIEYATDTATAVTKGPLSYTNEGLGANTGVQ
jgi:hypothetical protein